MRASRLASASRPSGAVSTMTQSKRCDASWRISRHPRRRQRAHRIGIRPSGRQQRQRVGDLDDVSRASLRRLQAVVEAGDVRDVEHVVERRPAQVGVDRAAPGGGTTRSASAPGWPTVSVLPSPGLALVTITMLGRGPAARGEATPPAGGSCSASTGGAAGVETMRPLSDSLKPRKSAIGPRAPGDGRRRAGTSTPARAATRPPHRMTTATRRRPRGAPPGTVTISVGPSGVVAQCFVDSTHNLVSWAGR